MVTSFRTVIPVDGNDVEFNFHTMNVKKVQLFQVYVMHDGKKHRFHVQVNDQGAFEITDPNACPEPCRGMSYEFSDVILKRFEKTS